jgi:hypothetical protein
MEAHPCSAPWKLPGKNASRRPGGLKHTMLSRDISLPSFSDLREESTTPEPTPPERWPAGSPPCVAPIPEADGEEEGDLPADAFCRICLDATTARSMLIAPCKCVPTSAFPRGQ